MPIVCRLDYRTLSTPESGGSGWMSFFFSEEKTQKTFVPCCSHIREMTGVGRSDPDGMDMVPRTGFEPV